MERIISALLLVFLLPAFGLTQERVKFPVGVSSKVLGYGHLWAAWRLKYFEREGLDVDVVLMRGTAPAVQAMIANSISAGLIANDGPIAAVEQGMDIAMIASSSKITHMLMGGKNYKTWEDLRGSTIGSSTLTSGTAFVLRRALKTKGLEYPRDYKLLNVGGTTSAFAAMSAGQISAAMLAVPNAFQAQEGGLQYNWPHRGYFPDLSSFGLFGKTQLGREEPHPSGAFFKSRTAREKVVRGRQKSCRPISRQRIRAQASTGREGTRLLSRKSSVAAGI
jgi:ABC-type nitrate/sulfonate/bicarbonate transport system substrate-binding protein